MSVCVFVCVFVCGEEEISVCQKKIVCVCVGKRTRENKRKKESGLERFANVREADNPSVKSNHQRISK